ncbi:hypothetical protein [Chenggangzhangella methanolivorans]|nr:hypothetical protein [Chenggangzhangella methanolivorans]
MKPWVAVIGVIVLVQFAFAVNPLLGLLVAFAAGFIAFRRWLRRRKRNRR